MTNAALASPPSRSLVVGFDLSVAADDAADVTARLAALRGDRVVVVHASPLALYSGTPWGQRLRAILTDESSGLARHGAAVDVVVEDRRPAPLLAEVAADANAELVVVGDGGSARELVQTCGAPVLVLRDSAVIDAWLRRERPLRVVVAANFDDALPALREQAAFWRRLGPVDLIVEHSSFPPEEHARLGAEPPTHVIENDPAVESLVRSELMHIFANIPGDGSVTLHSHVNLGKASGAVANSANDAHADLVIVASHHRHGLEKLLHGNTAEGVLNLAKGNIVVVPAG